MIRAALPFTLPLVGGILAAGCAVAMQPVAPIVAEGLRWGALAVGLGLGGLLLGTGLTRLMEARALLLLAQAENTRQANITRLIERTPPARLPALTLDGVDVGTAPRVEYYYQEGA
jgi:hypothetical protein